MGSACVWFEGRFVCWAALPLRREAGTRALGRWAQRRIRGGSGRVFWGRAAVGLAGASGAELSGGGCAGLLREGRWLGGREARRGGSLCSRCGGESGRVETCIVKFCVAGVCRFGNVSVWSGGSARRALSGPGGRSVLHAWLVAAIGGGVAPSDFPPMGGSGRGAAAGAAGAVSSIARERLPSVARYSDSRTVFGFCYLLVWV